MSKNVDTGYRALFVTDSDCVGRNQTRSCLVRQSTNSSSTWTALNYLLARAAHANGPNVCNQAKLAIGIFKRRFIAIDLTAFSSLPTTSQVLSVNFPFHGR